MHRTFIIIIIVVAYSRRGPSRRCTTMSTVDSIQRSPVKRVESFRSWSNHLFSGRPGGRRYVRSGGRLSDTLMWSWRAMFAGVSSSSRATCPNTKMRRRERRRDSEVRPVRCSTSSFRTRSYHRIPSSCLIRHFWWKASRVLTSADSKVQVSAAYSNTDKTSVWYRPTELVRSGRYWPSDDYKLPRWTKLSTDRLMEHYTTNFIRCVTSPII